MITALMPFIIAAIIVLIIVLLKVAALVGNNRRKADGKAPYTEEKPIVNVIDWTRR